MNSDFGTERIKTQSFSPVLASKLPKIIVSPLVSI